MKRVCIVINKGLIFLVCNHVKRRPGWMTIQYMKRKIELSSQRREMCLSSNMAAVMSDANQQCPYKTSRSAADLQQIYLMKNRLTADYFSVCRLFQCLQSLFLVCNRHPGADTTANHLQRCFPEAEKQIKNRSVKSAVFASCLQHACSSVQNN